MLPLCPAPISAIRIWGLPVCENIHYIIEGGGDFYKYKETIAGKSCIAERLFLMLGG